MRPPMLLTALHDPSVNTPITSPIEASAGCCVVRDACASPDVADCRR
jgi:hypothetical protein